MNFGSQIGCGFREKRSKGVISHNFPVLVIPKEDPIAERKERERIDLANYLLQFNKASKKLE